VADRLHRAQDLLRRAGVLEVLAAYTPVIAGTVPLGIDTEGSDLDVLCEANNAEAFVRDALAFAALPGFALHRKGDADPPAVVCRFSVEGMPVEVFAQARPVRAQRAHRHLVAERRLLEAAGEGAAEEIRRLKRRGVKTEPAFAEYFALPGDPCETLLAVAEWSDAELSTAVGRGRRLRRKCPFCAIVGGAQASLVYEDAWTQAFMNRRQANPGHVLVIPRRHIPAVYDLDADTAAALGRATARVAQAVRGGLGVTDLNVWQSNGEAAGQEIGHVHVHLLPRRTGDGWFRVYPPGEAPPPCPRQELDALARRIRHGFSAAHHPRARRDGGATEPGADG
jgi:diadenosine tetraphosphate (Ap4A) HIT family hydrolase